MVCVPGLYHAERTNGKRGSRVIKFVFWRYHSKYEEEHEDSELFDVLRLAIYLEEHAVASVESVTLPDGAVLERCTEIEEYYEIHRNDEHAVEGSAIVLDDQMLIGQEVQRD
jgi:hypothetical protein